MKSLWDKVVDADAAASLIKDGMIVGVSGFTPAGEAKVVPRALAERAKREPLKITLMTGASLGSDVERMLTDAKALSRRLPFQGEPTLRAAINRGEVLFVDQHLSETVELLRSRQMGPIDVAVIEVAGITEDGGLIPTTSIGNSATFAILAKELIIELNLTQPMTLEGLHDVYIPTRRPYRAPIPVLAPDARVGQPYIAVDPSRIKAIVVTEKADSCLTVLPPDGETRAIAGHLTELLKYEVSQGRFTNTLAPLQAGIGAIANAVMHGLIDSPFHKLKMYSEVLQDSTFDLFDAGKLDFASGSSMTLTTARHHHILSELEHYKSRLVLRPQEISNHPEVIRRLGVIGINTALEADIYGNVNSTHVQGTHMMNGIGGSGDFARNAYMSVFVTKSTAKNGSISSIVPMVSHVDHPEHDVDILVTECGLADLRGLAPRERAALITENCVHPSYRDLLRDYMRSAAKGAGHTPHVLEEAFAWHTRFRETGSMREAQPA
jgi:succinyl-CoA:acetate CoA-transferase